jgi:ubiquinone/menaquinone biosynthesis C-methylase UbiE
MLILSLANDCKEYLRLIAFNIFAPQNNQAAYESDDVVQFYNDLAELQKPELTILQELGGRLPKMRMLDIGVGAGRTTAYFASLAKGYLGIDYSKKMIEACVKKFGSCSKNICFEVSDARTLEKFECDSFDFVLFSFNGLDYMNHKERINSLWEIRRMLRAGGYFCFSTHNLNFLLSKCSIKLSKHPMIIAHQIIELIRMRFLNTNEAWRAIRDPSRKGKHCMVNDGALNFRLKTYYITHNEQLEQLNELGFKNVKMFNLARGLEIKKPSDETDHWIYYLSQSL